MMTGTLCFDYTYSRSSRSRITSQASVWVRSVSLQASSPRRAPGACFDVWDRQASSAHAACDEATHRTCASQRGKAAAHHLYLHRQKR